MQEVSDIRPNGSWLWHTPNQNISWASGTLDTSGVLSTCFAGLNELGYSESFPSEIANRALIKARSNLKGQNINLGQAFGERKQTEGLVADSLRRVAGMAQAIRDRDPRRLERYIGNGVSNIARDFPQAWLEYQYGWKPLLSDIHGAITALDSQSLDRWKVTVRGSAKSKVAGEVIKKLSDDPLANYKVKVDVLHGCKVRIDAVPSSAALTTAAALGIANPLSLAWELLPWSFVVDWAWPLGSYFDSFDALAGWDIMGFSSSSFTKATIEAKGVAYDLSNGWHAQNNWEGKRRYVSLSRSNDNTVPFPAVPSFKDPTSNVHVLNALALLAGVFSGRKPVR
jgi:hypothetical protein